MAEADAPRMVKITVKPAMKARIPRSSRLRCRRQVAGAAARSAPRVPARRPPASGSGGRDSPAPTVRCRRAPPEPAGSALSSAADSPDTIDR